MDELLAQVRFYKSNDVIDYAEGYSFNSIKLTTENGEKFKIYVKRRDWKEIEKLATVVKESNEPMEEKSSIRIKVMAAPPSSEFSYFPDENSYRHIFNVTLAKSPTSADLLVTVTSSELYYYVPPYKTPVSTEPKWRKKNSEDDYSRNRWPKKSERKENFDERSEDKPRTNAIEQYLQKRIKNL